MVLFVDPDVQTIERNFDFDNHEEVSINKMSKPILSIIKGSGSNPWETVPLDNDSRKFIHVSIQNVI